MLIGVLGLQKVILILVEPGRFAVYPRHLREVVLEICGHVACVRARLESSVFLFSGSLTDCGLLVAFLTSLKISQMMHCFLFILIFAGSPFAGKLQPLSPVILT